MDSSSTTLRSESSASKSQSQHRRGVRVVGKIRPFLSSEIPAPSDRGNSSSTSASTRISFARQDGDHAEVTFGDQPDGSSRRNTYKLDWCYDQNEGVGEIFSQEVKPLLQGIYQGCNACVIAYGARQSGKTQMIQGSEENSGIATAAMSEILSFAEENSGSVAISCFEVYQDHIYDLSEPKEQEVLVLEDAGRRIQLKGLSQVPVKSIAEFEKLYFHGCNQRKLLQKAASDDMVRAHRGLIIYVSSVDKETNHSIAGKMSFLDLAGYEDPKQKNNANSNLAESTKINKSSYAVLNVVHALNANETYIPYRESKLTRLLQDFMSKSSGAVLIACLNPTMCQDTIHVVSLASRSCQVVNQHKHDSAKNFKIVSRPIPPWSPFNGGPKTLGSPAKRHELSQFASIEKKKVGNLSAAKRRPLQPSTSVTKPGISFSEKKSDDSPSMIKGRRLFNVSSPSTTCVKGDKLLNVSTAMDTLKQENISVDVASAVNTFSEENISVDVASAVNTFSEENISVDVASDVNTFSEDILKDNCPSNGNGDFPNTYDGLEVGAKLSSDPCDCSMNKDQVALNDVSEPSPPLSERLREISNSLKLLSTQSMNIETPKANLSCTNQMSTDIIEPKTPGDPFNLRLDGDLRFENIGSPRDRFKNRSTGLKKSLVQECLTFLNSANKEELKGLKGIGERRATRILQLREKTPEPFKEIDDIKELGLSSKQINGMISGILGDF